MRRTQRTHNTRASMTRVNIRLLASAAVVVLGAVGVATLSTASQLSFDRSDVSLATSTPAIPVLPEEPLER